MRTLLLEMPLSVRGFTREDANGEYTIVINALLNDEARAKTLEHELSHIKRNDFAKESKATEIEKEIRLP